MNNLTKKMIKISKKQYINSTENWYYICDKYN
jgi:hypothetical protein